MLISHSMKVLIRNLLCTKKHRAMWRDIRIMFKTKMSFDLVILLFVDLISTLSVNLKKDRISI